MKEKLIYILLLLSTLSYCYAEEGEQAISAEDEFEMRYFGRGLIDGRVWNKLTNEEKAIYLFGFEDGVTGIALHFIPEGGERSKVYNTLPTSAENNPSMSEIIERIDELYSDDNNISIPMYYALLIVRNRLIGVDEEEIERYIEYLRDSEGKEFEKVFGGKETVKEKEDIEEGDMEQVKEE